MIADAVARIQAIEQQLTEKTQIQLQTRLAIRGCLKELRDISGHRQLAADAVGNVQAGALIRLTH